MILEIFDVEHGACALVTTSNWKRLLIDCGHNATTGWRPGTALFAAGIHNIHRHFVTNFDEDHVSGYPDLTSKVDVQVLMRNPTVRPNVIEGLKEENGMGPGIKALVGSMRHTFTGGPPSPFEDFGDTKFSVYWNDYGLAPLGFDDENNLSLVSFITCGSHKIIFPGDMEKAGWLKLLQNPTFAAELNDVTLFVASHHGRVNGYCEEVMKLCPNINAVVISDKKKGFQSQDTVDAYGRYASGFLYNGVQRRVLTTRRDSSMKFEITPGVTASVLLGIAA